MFKLALPTLAGFWVATAAGAHPGYGQPGEAFSLLHYLSEPSHVLVSVATGLVVLVLVRARSLAKARAAGAIGRD